MSTDAITVIVVAVLAAGLTFAIVRLLDRLTRRDAETEARRIVEEANRNAENRKKEAELEIKEVAIQQRAAGEKEHGQIRQELHERERLLDKRQ
ncbi:MAG TPA: Rnase Y domain-containing protein, partial [Pirellulales bacterium]